MAEDAALDSFFDEISTMAAAVAPESVGAGGAEAKAAEPEAERAPKRARTEEVISSKPQPSAAVAAALGVAAPIRTVLSAKPAAPAAPAAPPAPSVQAQVQDDHNRLQAVRERESAAAAAVAAGAQAKGPVVRSGEGIKRRAGGKTWVDHKLADWPDDDYRLFVGDLSNEITDSVLNQAFSKYPSFNRSRVVRDKTNKSKGFGFVSFTDPYDCAKAMREMNNAYIGNRPITLKKSKWQDRNLKPRKQRR